MTTPAGRKRSGPSRPLSSNRRERIVAKAKAIAKRPTVRKSGAVAHRSAAVVSDWCLPRKGARESESVETFGPVTQRRCNSRTRVIRLDVVAPDVVAPFLQRLALFCVVELDLAGVVAVEPQVVVIPKQ